MSLEKEKYFYWNILYPFLEIESKFLTKIYFDQEFSPLKFEIENLCIKILSIFEHPLYDKKQERDALNSNKSSCFHRVFSLGIKSKHGKVTSKYYSDINLKLPLVLIYYPNEEKYNYGYDVLSYCNGKESQFFNDLSLTLYEMIHLFSLKISFNEKRNLFSPIYPHIDFFNVHMIDTHNFLSLGLSPSVNLKTFTCKNDTYIATDFQDIRLAIIDPSKTV